MTWKRQLIRLLLMAAVFCGGVLGVLLALENNLVYFPTGTEDWNAHPELKVEDVWLRTEDGTAIHAWWCPRDGTADALLYCHGNAGNLSYRSGPVAEMQKELGVSVLIFDYPGYGKSAGRPSEAGCYAAADAAYDWLTQTQRVRPDRLLLYGKSLGGGVAVDLASRRPHRALVLVKTFTTLPDVGQAVYPFLPVRWVMRNRFDNLAKIGKCYQPVFIANGDCDTLTPCHLGEALYAAANEPKRYLSMSGIGHDAVLSPEFYSSLREFLAAYEPAGTRAD